MGEQRNPQQLSMGAEFQPAQREDVEPPPRSDGRTDPNALKSALGVDREPRSTPTEITLDVRGRVVEGHLAWLAARDQRRHVRAMKKDYNKEDYFKALAAERADLASAGRCAEHILPKAAVAGEEAHVGQAGVAKTLNISQGQVSRLLRREELKARYADYIKRGVTDSHLEAVCIRSIPENRRRELLDRAVADKLSVRKFEQLVRAGKLADRRIPPMDQPYLDALEKAGFAEELRNWNKGGERYARMTQKLIRVIATDNPELLAGMPRGIKHGRAA